VGFQRMAKMLRLMNFVPIPAPFLMPGDNASLREMPHDAHGGTLGYASVSGNIPHPSTRILGEADQDMRMIAKEMPYRVGFAHEMSPPAIRLDRNINHDKVNMLCMSTVVGSHTPDCLGSPEKSAL
jgi:hypothetical protein